MGMGKPTVRAHANMLSDTLTILSRLGLCFSVPKGVRIPPSLNNVCVEMSLSRQPADHLSRKIYAEISAEYPDFVAPKHG